MVSCIFDVEFCPVSAQTARVQWFKVPRFYSLLPSSSLLVHLFSSSSPHLVLLSAVFLLSALLLLLPLLVLLWSDLFSSVFFQVFCQLFFLFCFVGFLFLFYSFLKAFFLSLMSSISSRNCLLISLLATFLHQETVLVKGFKPKPFISKQPTAPFRVLICFTLKRHELYQSDF